jgi:hypothetical protein
MEKKQRVGRITVGEQAYPIVDSWRFKLKKMNTHSKIVEAITHVLKTQVPIIGPHLIYYGDLKGHAKNDYNMSCTKFFNCVDQIHIKKGSFLHFSPRARHRKAVLSIWYYVIVVDDVKYLCMIVAKQSYTVIVMPLSKYIDAMLKFNQFNIQYLIAEKRIGISLPKTRMVQDLLALWNKPDATYTDPITGQSSSFYHPAIGTGDIVTKIVSFL